MLLKFRVDQVRAFSKGIDTRSAMELLEVDPATLAEAERELLASRMNAEGKVCSRNKEGMFSNGYSVVPKVPTRDHHERSVIPLVTAVEPTLEALLHAIREEETVIEAYQATKAAEEATTRAQRLEATQRVLDEGQVVWHRHDVYAWYEQDGILRVEEGSRPPRRGDVRMGLASYTFVRPDWPSAYEESVVETPEAQAWQAALDTANQAARQEAEEAARRALHVTMRQQEEREHQERLQAEAQEREIAAWVQAHGTPNQQARFLEGFLDREEALSALREEAFRVLEQQARYERLTASDVCICREEYGVDAPHCRVEFESGTMESLTAEQYEAVLAVRALLPGARVTPRWHAGISRDCEQEVTRYSLHVEVVAGAFTFTREYALA